MNEIENLAVGAISDQAFSVFPNPASDHISLTRSFDHVSIISITGQVVFKISDYQANQEISLEDLADGMYLIRATSENQDYIRKLIIR